MKTVKNASLLHYWNLKCKKTIGVYNKRPNSYRLEGNGRETRINYCSVLLNHSLFTKSLKFWLKEYQ